MNNKNFPWVIAVPRQPNLRELYDLTEQDYYAVMREVRDVTQKLAAHTRAHKMNVASLGNMVEQLHIHIIARFKDDLAWPNPVWSVSNTNKYDAHSLHAESLKYAYILIG